MKAQRDKVTKAHSPLISNEQRATGNESFPASSLIGLYIHIPFCAARCHYCDFFTFAGKENLIDDYVSALCYELMSLSREHDVTVKTIFFGGGTPSILQPAHFDKIFNTLHRNFTVIPDAEITVECNPGTLTKEKVRALKYCGVNRISLGVQSMNDEELKFLGRIHTSSEVIENYNLLRREGFSNINMDFIFGFPGHTLKEWKDTLAHAVSFHPDHLSAYNFILEEETKFYELHLKGKLKLIDDEEELRHYEFLIDFLASHGFHHYEISNFAKFDHECKHNLIYWENEDYLGAGPSAWSYINGERRESTRDLKTYIKTQGAGGRGRGAVKKEKISKQEISDTLMMGLRLTKGISLKTFQGKFGQPLEKLHGGTIEKFTRLGLMETYGDYLRLTRKGLFLSNEVLCEFI